MSPNVKRYRDVAIVVVLLAIPFFVLRANMKRPENLNALDRFILRVSAPIEFGASSVARGISNLWGDYVYLVDVKKDNARLAYDNARLRENVHRLEQTQAENQQLQRLLQLKESLPVSALSAQVIGKDFTEFFRVYRVVLDRGSRDVRTHMPVVCRAGGVGAVQHVAGDLDRRRASRSMRRSRSTSKTSGRRRAASCAAWETRPATPAKSRWSTHATRSR